MKLITGLPLSLMCLFGCSDKPTATNPSLHSSGRFHINVVDIHGESYVVVQASRGDGGISICPVTKE